MEGQSSTALSALGQQQAQQLAQSLVTPPLSIQALPTHLYSSPLLRADETAQALSQALRRVNHPLICQYSPNLQEIHQGIFQGLTWPEAIQKFPDLCTQLMGSLEWQPVPQAETLVEARDRAAQWLGDLERRHQANDVIWVVSHAGIMQYLIAAILGCDRTWHIPIHHTAIFEFWRSADTASDPCHRHNPQRWQLKRFNDVSHL